MRIGINASYFAKPATGIGVVTLQFLRSLAVLPESRVHEWFWYYEGQVPAGEWPEHFHFVPVKTWWSRDDIPHRYLWERFALSRAVAHDHCEVFFSLYQSATVLPKQIRHVMLVHDLIPKRFPEYLANSRQRLYYHAIERAIRSASQLIVPSLATAADLKLLLAQSEEKIHVAPLGIDPRFSSRLVPADLMAVLSRHGLAPGYLYHGGGLEIRKNTELVLRAYAKLCQTGKQGVPELVISGKVHASSNPLATPVARLIEELGIGERVKLIGFAPDEDLPALYQGALAFIFPSRYEGFGLPVLEAFASGTPVITTVAGSLGELADGAAHIVDPDDIDGLTDGLQRILNEPSYRAELSRLGQERSSSFTWSGFASKAFRCLVQ